MLDAVTRGTLSFTLFAGVLSVLTASLHTGARRRRGITGLECNCYGSFPCIHHYNNNHRYNTALYRFICYVGNRNSFKLRIA